MQAPMHSCSHALTFAPVHPCLTHPRPAALEEQEQEDGELYQLHVIAGCANSNVEFFADLVLSATNVTATFSQVLAL